MPHAALGVAQFGQSGSIEDLYRYNGIDTDSIIRAALDLVPLRRPTESMSRRQAAHNPGRPTDLTAGFRNRALEPVMTLRFIAAAAKLAHAASIAACPAHPDQSRRYAPPHGSRCLADE